MFEQDYIYKLYVYICKKHKKYLLILTSYHTLMHGCSYMYVQYIYDKQLV